MGNLARLSGLSVVLGFLCFAQAARSEVAPPQGWLEDPALAAERGVHQNPNDKAFEGYLPGQRVTARVRAWVAPQQRAVLFDIAAAATLATRDAAAAVQAAGSVFLSPPFASDITLEPADWTGGRLRASVRYSDKDTGTRVRARLLAFATTDQRVHVLRAECLLSEAAQAAEEKACDAALESLAPSSLDATRLVALAAAPAATAQPVSPPPEPPRMSVAPSGEIERPITPGQVLHSEPAEKQRSHIWLILGGLAIVVVAWFMRSRAHKLAAAANERSKQDAPEPPSTAD